jgi:hypothetical protein
MALRHKAAWIGGVFLGGGLIVLVGAIEYLPAPFNFLAVIVWAGIFGVLYSTQLNCPHCGRGATETESGIFRTPWVGTICKFCHKGY